MSVKVRSRLVNRSKCYQNPKEMKKSTQYKLSAELVMSRAMSNKRKHIVPSHGGLVGMKRGKRDRETAGEGKKRAQECERKKRQNRAGLI